MKVNKADFRREEAEMPNGKKIVFYHNLPDTFGLNIEGAFTNWYVRTKKYTVESLAEYVQSKGTGHIVLTEKQYNDLK